MSNPERYGLVERTIANIRSFIVDEQLLPGANLPAESALAEQLGVSRTITREALRGLAALGIVEVGNGRRARVASTDADALSMILDHAAYTRQVTIQQILEVRRTLELRTAALAALRRTDAQSKRLLQIVTDMLEALDSDAERIMELDILFHETIAQSTGNALYGILVASFRVIIRQTWHTGWRARATYENRLENIRCHERIAKAITAQDSAAAEEAMAEHFDNAVSVLLKAGII